MKTRRPLETAPTRILERFRSLQSCNCATSVNGKLFFANDDPAHGVELWQSDGTVAGTGLFLDLNPGAAGSFPGNMAVINNTLYFSATTAAGSSALWSSNGTATGTNVVATFDSQPDGDGLFDNASDSFAVLGNTMVFPADDGTNQSELWKTDGTASGTTMIKVLAQVSPPYVYAPSDFTTVGGKVFFVTQSRDGNALGDRRYGRRDDRGCDDRRHPHRPDGVRWEARVHRVHTRRDELFAVAERRDRERDHAGRELSQLEPELRRRAGHDGGPWRQALHFGPSASQAHSQRFCHALGQRRHGRRDHADHGAPVTATVDSLAVFEGKVYFSADTALGNPPRDQVWVTDGTAAGTRMVANVGPAYAIFDRFLVAGPSLYIFTRSNTPGTPSEDLYKSDGTGKGTMLIHVFANGYLDAASGLPNGELAVDVGGTLPNPIRSSG